MAAATLFGPVVAGALVDKYGWGVMTAAMGVFAFSGAIPTVSHPVMPVQIIVQYAYVGRIFLTRKRSSYIQVVGYSRKSLDIHWEVA